MLWYLNVDMRLNTYAEYIFWAVGTHILLMKSVEFIHELVTEMTLE